MPLCPAAAARALAGEGEYVEAAQAAWAACAADLEAALAVTPRDQPPAAAVAPVTVP